MKNIFGNQLSIILSLALSGFVLIGCQKQTTQNNINQRPNIIYVLADDLGYGDLSCYGQSKFKTPNIDKLASKGMLFTQHYAGSSVCSPSRSSLLTGQHTGHTFIRGNKKALPVGNYPLDSTSITVAEILKHAGYVTGAFGKWGLGYTNTVGDPKNHGFDKFYGYKSQTLAHNYYPYHLWDNDEKIVLENNTGILKGTYAPNLIHEKAISFIEKHKDSTFFMYYASIMPHAELEAPDSYINKYRGEFLPENEYIGVEEGEKRFKQGGYGSQKEPRAAFAAMIDLLDKQVGDIVTKLDELGIAQNTIIIFTSDNGPHQEGGADPDYFDSNGKLRGYKRDLYEGGIRVPMIAYWPNNIKPKTISTRISAFWDFLPTICDLLQVEQPNNIDGISFLPALLSKEQKEHEYLYWEFHEQGGRQAVRLGDWKGVRLNMQNDPKATIELYNIATDISEQNNIAMDNPEIVKNISEIMEKEHTQSREFSFEYEKE